MDGPLKIIVHARKNLMLQRDRVVFFKDGQEFLPGTPTRRARPHLRPPHVHDPVGRQVIRFPRRPDPSSGAAAGTSAHEFAYDSDPKMAAATRVKMLDMPRGQQDGGDVVSFPVAGYGHGEGWRRLPLHRRTDDQRSLTPARNVSLKRQRIQRCRLVFSGSLSLPRQDTGAGRPLPITVSRTRADFPSRTAPDHIDGAKDAGVIAHIKNIGNRVDEHSCFAIRLRFQKTPQIGKPGLRACRQALQ
jgi:hypothetical protein